MTITPNYPSVVPPEPISYTLVLTPSELHDLQVIVCLEDNARIDQLSKIPGSRNSGRYTTDKYGLMKAIRSWRP